MLPIRAFGAAFLLVILQALSAGASFADESFMVLGKQARQPIGHKQFCDENPDECRRGTDHIRAPVDLDRELSRRVAAVNRQVNAAIRPASDRELYGREEHWAFPADRGDCEDYVLQKRRRLMAAGIAPSNLLITIVRKADGEGHAVLTLRAQQGDFILDNLDGDVRAFADTPYVYLKRQSSVHPAHWRSIEEGGDMVVAALP